MHHFCQTAPQTSRIAMPGLMASQKLPGEDAGENQEGPELPVNPDQGTPLVPDDEGVVTVPT